MLIAVVVCLIAARGAYAESPSEVEEAVTAAAQNYLKAFAARDVKGCMAAFVPGEKTVMMGTGPGERWVGLNDIGAAHKEMFKAFEKEEFKANWRVVNSRRRVAWTASEVAVTDTVGGQEKKFILHLSVVWVLRQDKWQIALMHYSNLTGPNEKPGS
jgi:ketosteroid isomerase-like protein